MMPPRHNPQPAVALPVFVHCCENHAKREQLRRLYQELRDQPLHISFALAVRDGMSIDGLNGRLLPSLSRWALIIPIFAMSASIRIRRGMIVSVIIFIGPKQYLTNLCQGLVRPAPACRDDCRVSQGESCLARLRHARKDMQLSSGEKIFPQPVDRLRCDFVRHDNNGARRFRRL
jgi:hypothetical protein